MEELFGFCQEVGPATPTEINMMVSWDTEIDPQEPIITLGALAFTDTPEQGIEQLSIFEDCPVLDKAIIARTGQVTTQDEISTNGADRHYLESKFYNGDCIWTNAPIDDTGPIFRDITNGLEGMSHILFTNFGFDDPPPRPPMAFSLDAKYYYGVYAVWDDPADERRSRDWLLGHMKALEPYSTGMPLADENLEDRAARFMSDENLCRLDRIRDVLQPGHGAAVRSRHARIVGRPPGRSAGTGLR